MYSDMQFMIIVTIREITIIVTTITTFMILTKIPMIIGTKQKEYIDNDSNKDSNSMILLIMMIIKY